MKIINELLIIEVPKGAFGICVIANNLTYTVTEKGAGVTHIELPSGYEYEVICLESNVTRQHMSEILHHAKQDWADALSVDFELFLIKHGFGFSTDLLFIKSITKNQ